MISQSVKKTFYLEFIKSLFITEFILHVKLA